MTPGTLVCTLVAGTLRRAVRSSGYSTILGGRHMECAYYFDFCRLRQIDAAQDLAENLR